jgi:hypothetical protein
MEEVNKTSGISLQIFNELQQAGSTTDRKTLKDGDLCA